jgi:hypothetical protein
MGTFKLQMKQGLEGQIRAQRQGDFILRIPFQQTIHSQIFYQFFFDDHFKFSENNVIELSS